MSQTEFVETTGDDQIETTSNSLLVGTWDLESSENWDDYLKALGTLYLFIYLF
jgi:hypothetical protein